MAYLGPAHHIAHFDKVKRAKTTLRSTSCAMCDTGGHRDESEVWQGRKQDRRVLALRKLNASSALAPKPNLT